jgi:carbon-monoxide dehydrogenase large subunit
MLHAAFVRGTAAHARIRGVDVDAARSAPGVVAVFTGEDVEALVHPGPVGIQALIGGDYPAYTLLCTDKVRFVGDPVVLVVAESRYLAEDACELVEIDFDDLPPVVSAEAAVETSSPPIFEDLRSNILSTKGPNVYGDIEGAFARADQVLHVRLREHRLQNVPMEGRGIVADPDPATGRLTVHVACQGVHLVRTTLATRLGVEPEELRIVAGDVGGSFGLKMGNSREEIACAAVAKSLGRPVKWIEDRNENLMASGQARDERFDVEAAITSDGVILGLKVRMLLDSGAYPGMGHIVSGTMQSVMPGPYRMEGLSFEETVAITNKASYVPYRGPWAGETFLRERLIDLIGAELGVEPIEIRMRNVINDHDPAPTLVTGRSLAGVTARQALDRIASLVDIPAFRRRQAAARDQGHYLGVGMASYIEGAPGPRGDSPLGHENIRARLEPDGTISLFTGQTPHGQGHETTLAQIAADEFGVPFQDVRVMVGDTDVVPSGFTGGSRSATLAGGASLNVARALRAKVLAIAGHLLEADAADLEIIDRAVAVRGVPTSALPLRVIATEASQPGRLPGDVDASLEVTIAYDGGAGGWSGGTHCAEDELDPETGNVGIRRYVVVEDCGVLINPSVVEGQVRGGVAQGIGSVLLERSAYGEDGQFLAGTFMDYLLPTATDIPRIDIEHLQTVPLDAEVNFRGVGEGGMIVAPVTICNAIADALAPFDVQILEQHLPPRRLLELMGAIEPE